MPISKAAGKVLLAIVCGLLIFFVLELLLSHETALAKDVVPARLPTVRTEVNKLHLAQNGLSFVFSAPTPELISNGRVEIAGLSDTTDIPSNPFLPYYSTLIVVPPESDINISVSHNEISQLFHPGLIMVPGPDLAPFLPSDSLSPMVTGIYTSTEKNNPQVGSKGRLFPEELYSISEPMYFRDLRLVRLNLFPLRYNHVSKHLLFTSEIEVSITFPGAEVDDRTVLKDSPGQTVSKLEGQILNIDQAEEWRSLPQTIAPESDLLPVGNPAFKIEVDKDGIYELTAEQLAAAGMVTGPGGIDPNTFHMMYRGNPVAYEFIGDGDASFDPGESIRFFGWAFDGSRLERQFFNNNVFWLWAGGEPVYIETKPSFSGKVVTEVPYSVTAEQDNHWFPTYTNQWEQFPNEPDAWYWHFFSTSYTPVSETFNIDLVYPVSNAVSATFTAEFSSRGQVDHQTTVALNSQADQATATWYGIKNLNVSGTIPASNLNHGANEFVITATSSSAHCGICIVLNRLTIDYRRLLITDNDEIIFKDEGGDPRQFDVGGFSPSLLDDYIVWDISDRSKPQQLLTETMELVGNGPYTLTFGTNTVTPSLFIASSVGNLLQPLSISTYEAIDLDSLAGGADWVAIAYHDFISETKRLATHRGSTEFGDLVTQVVDIEDVVNQYGYGLPIPDAIHSYMRHALENWARPPQYLLLVGDSTIDPRHSNPSWTDQQYIPTDLVFEDYWQGQIPSDHTYSLLVGDDLLPDLAVSRLSVRNEEELGRIIDKIIWYEGLQLLPSGWMENLYFVADADDPDAGFFCDESMDTGLRLPSSFNQTYYCLDNFGNNPLLMKEALIESINKNGSTIVNYRGHGGVNFWANILSTADMDLWENSNRPFFSISGDCLDAHFALPQASGLGEELMRAIDSSGKGTGAVGHWGSTGLGTSPNHSFIIDSFYDAMFDSGQVAIGDAATLAKVLYGTNPLTDPTLLWSFTLMGDPAMQLYRRSFSLGHIVQPEIAWPGDTVSFTIQMENNGIYPSHATISQTLPAGFEVISVTSSISASYEVVGDTVVFDLQFGEELKDKGLPRNGMALLTVVVEIQPETASGKAAAFAQVSGTGLEAWPGDEEATAWVTVVRPSVRLPFIRR